MLVLGKKHIYHGKCKGMVWQAHNMPRNKVYKYFSCNIIFLKGENLGIMLRKWCLRNKPKYLDLIDQLTIIGIPINHSKKSFKPSKNMIWSC